ncbi:MAG: S8 family serine peptidase [Clostridiales bacterium]|jgi:serine protease AprX|nr:S8 family serine peptidase [Clostridiales bacterium]
MIEKKLDFESYIRFARGGERAALVYIHSFAALKYLARDFDITHRFPFINAVAVSGDFADIRRLSASPYVEYITAQSRVFALNTPGADTVSEGGGTNSRRNAEDLPPKGNDCVRACELEAGLNSVSDKRLSYTACVRSCATKAETERRSSADGVSTCGRACELKGPGQVFDANGNAVSTCGHVCELKAGPSSKRAVSVCAADYGGVCARGFNPQIAAAYAAKPTERNAYVRGFDSDITAAYAAIAKAGCKRVRGLGAEIGRLRNAYRTDENIRARGLGSEVFLNDSETVRGMGLKTDFTGRGVTLAVLDTGIQPHLDICAPVNRIKDFYDVYGKSSLPYDDNGHGTFVAGIAAGNGFTSAGKVRGVAPRSELVGVKVISSSGECGAFSVLEGMQWTLDNARRLQIKVVCMSFGSDPLPSGDPLKLGAETLVKNGVTVVCASGNSGENGLKSPAISSDVISVGAINARTHAEADFSSRGWYGGSQKPDLYAVGVDVEGLYYRSAYTHMSGTSAAAPYIAGAACLLHEKYKNLTPRDVKRMLLASAENYEGKPVIEFSHNAFVSLTRV